MQDRIGKHAAGPAVSVAEHVLGQRHLIGVGRKLDRPGFPKGRVLGLLDRVHVFRDGLHRLIGLLRDGHNVRSLQFTRRDSLAAQSAALRIVGSRHPIKV